MFGSTRLIYPARLQFRTHALHYRFTDVVILLLDTLRSALRLRLRVTHTYHTRTRAATFILRCYHRAVAPRCAASRAHCHTTRLVCCTFSSYAHSFATASPPWVALPHCLPHHIPQRGPALRTVLRTGPRALRYSTYARYVADSGLVTFPTMISRLHVILLRLHMDLPRSTISLRYTVVYRCSRLICRWCWYPFRLFVAVSRCVTGPQFHVCCC